MSKSVVWQRLIVAFLFSGGILLFSSSTFARPNFNIDSLSFQPITGTKGCWGYVDSATQKEYALICATNRLEIWEVTNPAAPLPIRTVNAEPGASDLKQVRPYKNYAVAVNQFGGTNRAGLQIINLANPAAAATVARWPGPADPVSPNGAHTVHIDGDYAYLGMNGSGDSLRIVSLANPLAPVRVGTYMISNGFGQSHDSYVKGDTAYVAFLGGGFSAIDISNKSAPIRMADVLYPGAFTHNCWTTEDGRHLFTTDENTNGHLRVWDVQDPSSPFQVAEWKPPVPLSIIHNVQVKGNLLYASYYTEGVSVLDIEDPTQPVEVGHYDTAPLVSGASFSGCWDVFPYLPSGNLVASNLGSSQGMWVLRFNGARSGFLRGTVINWKTGQAVPNAAIRFLDMLRLVESDSAGNYLSRTEGGAVRLEFSHQDFRAETLTVNASFNDTVTVDTVRLVPLSEIPAAPQNLTARPDTFGNIHLSWQRPPAADLKLFRIHRTSLADTLNFFLFDSTAASETTYTDFGSTAGERFSYRISAVDSTGFTSLLSGPTSKTMRFVFGPKLLLVHRTGLPLRRQAFRDTIINFYLRALRRYDYDTLNLKDESFPIPAGISPGFVAGNRIIFVHSAELRTPSFNDTPLFFAYFLDFFKAGGKLVMDGHWPMGGVNASFLKCSFNDPPDFTSNQPLWDTLRSAFGFDCLFFPRTFPFDANPVNRTFLSAQPQQGGYPFLPADSARAAAGVAASYNGPPPYPYPTVPNIGYLTNRNPAEDLYTFGSLKPGSDPKQGRTVSKKHIDPATGGGFVWFNFPLFYMQEDSSKKAIRQALSDLGVQENFPKGDLNRDGLRRIEDIVYLLDYVFLGLPFPVFDPDEADLDCDRMPTASDVVLLIINSYDGTPLPCD